MPKFIVKGVNGTTIHQNPSRHDLYHDVAISSKGLTAGTLTITGRKVGSDEYEAIPDGAIDLSAKTSVQFTGSVESYQFVLTGVAGSGDIIISDTSQRA